LSRQVSNLNSSDPEELQKPDGLTTFGRSDGYNYIYLSIKFLTPVFGGQFALAKSGHGHWLFQWNKGLSIMDYKER
jgi:hypothetical protein